MKKYDFALAFLLFFLASLVSLVNADEVLNAMEEELERSFKALSTAAPVPLYYLHYEIWDEQSTTILASQGALYRDTGERTRYLDVDVRVGSPELDNTHEIRGGGINYLDWIPRINEIPIQDEDVAIRAALWKETDSRFKEAQEKYIKIQAEQQVKVAESDTSPDFSSSKAIEYIDPPVEGALDLDPWREKLRNYSSIFKGHPWIYQSHVSLRATELTKYQVNSEGSRIREVRICYRVSIYAATMAEDGMELYLSHSFLSFSPEALPMDIEVTSEIDTLIEHLDALRKAPIVEPYTGPAILVNRASGVFFHEIFGHRIEGHRQKSEFEGQTFTKKVGEQILPPFISVFDDPTMKRFDGKDLNGHYRFDDEAVPAEKVTVVENGILKQFLMSRSPIEKFPRSNGHGRRQYGRDVVARQGVLVVKSSNEASLEELRQALIDECKKQNKEYGLIFFDIAGGFTSTGRSGTQTFKVIPLFVKRIYVDGREDEVVRGVDIVGTPLLSFAKIELTGDDYDIFNGTCGAESGMVPISAVSPSIFVSEIEVEKKSKSQEKPPILPSPLEK
jgi:predicted Zn-dependent protease